MTLNYQLTLDDYIEANKAHIKKRPLGYYGLIGIDIFGFVACVVIVYFHFAGINKLDGNDIWILLLFIFAGFDAAMRTVFFKAKVKRSLKPYPEAFDKTLLIFSEQETSSNQQDSDSQIEWNKIKDVSETTSLFVLYVAMKSFHIIPKRAFANDDDLNQFRAWASQINHEKAQVPPLPEPK